ncbi:MAG: aminodeoxychorismate synthase component I, partial [Proteobacteria bacterium]|nr:aminodeoxychorismate synthase component I [Pseudomonadota bacterium]
MYCLIYDPDNNNYLEFQNPVSVFQTNDVSRVKECLENALNYSGQHIVGFISYEASPAFDDAFVSHSLTDTPLICFGVFDSFDAINPTNNKQKSEFASWSPGVNEKEYKNSLAKIKHHIAEGDTYQVNYTFKLTSHFSGDPRQLFFSVQEHVQAEYAAYIELETQTILSFSPELFFTRDKGLLTSKPMKGTAPRGLTTAEDKRLARELAGSGKNQAENIMIVDMIRNDMGKVAQPGTVRVNSLFDVLRYPYVLQMTSTVESQADAPLAQVFYALFPCASITGAPKYRTMKIINDLEPTPRGIYTGTIGHIDPEGRARFNVAIRTLVMDKKTGIAEYGVGSGIVWDSEVESEYRECLVKANFLKQQEPDFQLLESLLWTEKDGFFLLKNHLERLADSADYFDYVCPLKKINVSLAEFQKSIPLSAAKIRLLLH